LALTGIMGDHSAELDEAAGVLREDLGSDINPNSPKQLKEVLTEKGLGLTNTSEQTLKQSGHRLAGCVLNHRSAKKQMEQAKTACRSRTPPAAA